ncbi:MAG: hypothetical protein ACPLSJ_03100 [Thermosulfidibacteraceae bacterium]|jgi:hypothetical protein
MGAEKAVIVYCKNCGKMNLISERRLQHIDREPIKCWYCKNPLEIKGREESGSQSTKT